MPQNDDFARRLPGALFPAALTPVFQDGWAYVAGAALLTALLLMGSHIFGLASSHHLGFRQWVELVFDPVTGLRIAGVLVLGAACGVLRRGLRPAGPAAAAFLSPVLAAIAVLAAVMIVGSVIGVLDFITLLGDSVRSALDAICFELAVLVLSAAAAVWALGELDARRRTV